MKTNLFILLFLFVLSQVKGQLVSSDPAFPTADQPVTLTFDVKQASDSRAQGLLGLTDGVYLWSGAGSTEGGNAFEFQPTGQSDFNQPFEPGKMTFIGDDRWQITFTPRIYFNVPEGTPIAKLGLLLKNANGSAQTEDFMLTIYEEGTLEVSLNSPQTFPLFIDEGGKINISAEISQEADITIEVDGGDVYQESAATQVSYEYTTTGTGKREVKVTAKANGKVAMKSFSFLIRQATEEVTKPENIRLGINYSENATQAGLALQAPGKSSVYVIGDFNDWQPGPVHQMKKDGDIFWLEIEGLEAGKPYVFQYLVDESIQIADPYSELVSDPYDDHYIDVTTYPDLIDYPENPLAKGIASVVQTGQPAYTWQATNYERPSKENLVIYELLMRDYLGTHAYQTLIDSLDYLKNLGVNAIELMPIMEFKGNNSWGYNPNFFLAPDKYYGGKNALKALIDTCHEYGMAVILDIALNHTHESNPLAALYWDEANFRPSADNPWLNSVAKHPFNVFFDFNHESANTKAFVDSVNRYWLEEYKVDGFRFDLSKGFTQNFSSSVGQWSARDESRITLLKRMADKVWEKDPEAYVILEHFADNSEETELADYGMMLWGNMQEGYAQMAMGYQENANIAWGMHSQRGWQNPHLVSYMESHDEERLMYKLQQFGNGASGYSTKDLSTALDRIKAASAFFYTLPGPKMLWQFGELGYDLPINLCSDGSTVDNSCRTDPKPAKWDYFQDTQRLKLWKTLQALIQLRFSYEVFQTGQLTLTNNTSLSKEIRLVHPSGKVQPEMAEEMSVYIVGNFDVVKKSITANFPFAGDWYHYFSGGELLEVTDVNRVLSLDPGEFRLYTNYPITPAERELMAFVAPSPVENLQANTDNKNITLSWTSDSETATSFKILRAKEGEDFSTIGSVSIEEREYVDANLESEMEYTYQVVAVNKYGESASDEVTATAPLITGLKDDLSGFAKVYPNPASNLLTIAMDKHSTQTTEVRITDLFGRTLFEKVFTEVKRKEYTLSVNHLPSGLYFIHLEQGEQSGRERVLVK
ncbi:alpha-amylase family glycosyl hydrolase [Rapidithrix thailandica]|uniref:Alpha-amylase family glycosyl hydrolase n=1 Tax=Rapidithrix thailandica TaxID=413964 RepID=A0AAW9SDZ2_9BACT